MSTSDKERDILDNDHPREIPPEPKTDKQRIAELEAIIRLYEANGPMKVLYALNRKCNEIADLLNKHILADLAIEKASDKTFDRLKISWKDGIELAKSVKELVQVTGATGQESYDLSLPFVEQFSKTRPVK